MAIHNDISPFLFVIPGLTRNPVPSWIPAFAGMTECAVINVAVYISIAKGVKVNLALFSYTFVKTGSSRNRVGNVWVFPFIPPLIKGGLGGFSFPDLVKPERSLPSLHRVLVTPASY